MNSANNYPGHLKLDRLSRGLTMNEKVICKCHVYSSTFLSHSYECIYHQLKTTHIKQGTTTPDIFPYKCIHEILYIEQKKNIYM